MIHFDYLPFIGMINLLDKFSHFFVLILLWLRFWVGEGEKKISFICVHNSCRSQIAERLAKHFRGDEFDFYSAGTETQPLINQDSVRLVKKLYGIDMEQTQYSKLISDIPSVDVEFPWAVTWLTPTNLKVLFRQSSCLWGWKNLATWRSFCKLVFFRMGERCFLGSWLEQDRLL